MGYYAPGAKLLRRTLVPIVLPKIIETNTLVSIIFGTACKTKQRAFFVSSSSNDCRDRRRCPYLTAESYKIRVSVLICIVPFCTGTLTLRCTFITQKAELMAEIFSTIPLSDASVFIRIPVVIADDLTSISVRS